MGLDDDRCALRRSHVRAVNCARPATDPTYPGDEALQAMALRQCRRSAPVFLGTDQAPLHIVAFFPPEPSLDHRPPRRALPARRPCERHHRRHPIRQL